MTQVLDRPAPAGDPAVPATPENPYPGLTAADRCDSVAVTMRDGVATRGTCGAQAFIRAVFPDGLDLLFCGHCLGEQPGPTGEKNRERREGLEAAGAVLFSEYGRINLKPTAPNPENGF